MSRQKIVAGNWKMNGSLDKNKALVSDVLARVEGSTTRIIIAPPFPYLSQLADMLTLQVSLAAQNVSQHGSGAFTGEVSSSMLNDFGVTYVIVGHSERRSLYGETDSVVAEKVGVVLSSGMIPILCVGETLDQRNAGKTLEVCLSQLQAVVDFVGVEALVNIIVAYEPVWAIGTGLSATAEQAQDVHASLRSFIASKNVDIAASLSILYGGSVKASNSSELFSMPDIDGALVGGASLVADEFVGIVKSAG